MIMIYPGIIRGTGAVVECCSVSVSLFIISNRRLTRLTHARTKSFASPHELNGNSQILRRTYHTVWMNKLPKQFFLRLTSPPPPCPPGLTRSCPSCPAEWNNVEIRYSSCASVSVICGSQCAKIVPSSPSPPSSSPSPPPPKQSRQQTTSTWDIHYLFRKMFHDCLWRIGEIQLGKDMRYAFFFLSIWNETMHGITWNVEWGVFDNMDLLLNDITKLYYKIII